MTIIRLKLPKVILFLALLVSINSLGAESSPPSAWSLRYLARSSNFLLAASDAEIDHQPLNCQMRKSEPQTLSMKLKIQIDEKLKNLSNQQKEKIFREAPSCDKECTCDIYALFLEADPTPESKKILSDLNPKATNISAKDRIRCAQNFKEFCSSHLLKSLR